MNFYSPLRYPGGKKNLSKFFCNLLTRNNMGGGTYIEPYVGGGSVALHLLFNDIVSDIIINDKDRSIYAFWHSVLNDTDNLCKLIVDTPINIDEWNKQREIQKHKGNIDALSLGFSTFFLNRTNRSGIIKGGVIGGKEQLGEYKIDARFNKQELIRRIQNIAIHKNRIALYNCDAVQLLHDLENEMTPDTMVYLDPPYYVKGKGLYMNYYNDDDHKNIKKEIDQVNNSKWVITYDETNFIENLYNNYRMKEYTLNYCAAKKGIAKEYMFFSDNCIIPNDDPIFINN